MALPRLVTGQYNGVSTFLNAAAQEIDYLSVAGVVHRTPRPIDFSANPNTFYTISWDESVLDTFGGMFSPLDPFTVRIRYNGIYTLTMQLRFKYDTAIPAYATGTRSGYIMLNSQTPAATRDSSHGTLASDIKPWSTSGEGVTLNMTATAALLNGHYVYGMFRHTASGNIEVLSSDFGGSYLSVVRIGPYPG